MGLWDKLTGELIDVIEWLDPSNDTMVHRFERHQNEIKYGAKLVVREGQAAIFVNEGALADVFQPGTYTLETQNLPVLTTLLSWPRGFESPFKAEVYFVSTRRFTDCKWGTKNPVMVRDAEFGPLRLRAFGSYVVRVSDPATFLREIVGTDGHFTTDEVVDQLRNIIASRFADALGEANIPALDLASQYDELGKLLSERVQTEFANYGLEVTKLLVENIALPESVEQALDKRSSMGVIGNMQQFTQYQGAEAMRDAAQNPSGTAAAGMGMGMGFAMGNQMGQAMSGQPQPGAAPNAAPPPLPQAVAFYAAVNGQQAGPFDVNTLGQMIARGELTRDTLVWKQGMASWTAAGEVSELQQAFGAAPPPLPGTP